MDNLSLEVLFQELKPRILERSIQKIRQISERTFVFVLRAKATEYLVLFLQPSLPGLFLSIEDLPSAGVSSDALQVLRKYLLGGKIIGLKKELSDRVIFLEIENYRLSEKAERFALTLELIPNRANLLLLNVQSEVIASLVVTKNNGKVLPGRYFSPQVKAAYKADQITEEEFALVMKRDSKIQAADQTTSAPGTTKTKVLTFCSNISGISPVFAREIHFESQCDIHSLWERFQALLQRVREGPYSPRIYFLPVLEPEKRQEVAAGSSGRPSVQPGKWVVSPFPLDSLPNAECELFPSMNALCEKLFRSFNQRTYLANHCHSQLPKIKATLKKKHRLFENLNSDLKESRQCEKFKKFADLLYAQQDKTLRGTEKLRVTDLYDPNLNEMDIPLDGRLTVVQNANRYSKLFQRAKRSINQLSERIRIVEIEIKNLDFEQSALLNPDSVKEPSRLDSSGKKTEFVRAESLSSRRASSHKKTEASSVSGSQSLQRKVARVYVSSEGMQILVGKTSKDNDTLTLKIARNDDFWLHVAGYAGSHVVLRNSQKLAKPTSQSLLEAAQLAAYFSQARNAPKIEVHYTQKKFVSKPKGAKPGLVRLKEYKSISVHPQLMEEAKDGLAATSDSHPTKFM